MDGSAITVGLGATPTPDWLKDVVPVLGLQLKVHNALRTFYNACQVSLLGVHVSADHSV